MILPTKAGTLEPRLHTAFCPRFTQGFADAGRIPAPGVAALRRASAARRPFARAMHHSGGSSSGMRN